MEAWIALGFVAAWLGDGPAMNQPRAQVAKPLPSVVVPAVVEPAFIPPAPLPELGILQVHFELATPESCQDSHVHPPAPPAELDVVHLMPKANRRAIRMGEFEIHLVGADDAEESAECPEPMPFQFLPEIDGIFRKGTPLPAQLFSSELPSPLPRSEAGFEIELQPGAGVRFETSEKRPPGTINLFLGEQSFLSARLEAREAAAEDGCSSPIAANPPVNKDVVQHLQSAIQHLEATGQYLESADLKRALDLLRRGREQAVEKLLRQELEAKEAELQRLMYEVEQLKKDLMSEARTQKEVPSPNIVIRFQPEKSAPVRESHVKVRLEHFQADLIHLRELAGGPAGEAKDAARAALAEWKFREERPLDPLGQEMLDALRRLGELKEVSVLADPELIVPNGKSAEFHRVLGQQERPDESPDHSFQWVTEDVGINFQAHAALQPNDRVTGEYQYDYLSSRGSSGSFSLELGQSVCTGGFATSGEQNSNGVITKTEECSLIFVTASRLAADEPLPVSDSSESEPQLELSQPKIAAAAEPKHLIYAAEHYRFDAGALQTLADDPASDFQEAARIVLQLDAAPFTLHLDAAPKSRITDAEAAARYQAAVHHLLDGKYIQVIARPQMRTIEGQEATVMGGGVVPLTTRKDDAIGEPDSEYCLRVKGKVLKNGAIKSIIAYEATEPVAETAVTISGYKIPGKNKRKVQTRFEVQPGRTMCLAGMKSTRSTKNEDGTTTEKEETDVILITPRIVGEQTATTQRPGSPDGRVRLTDATEELAPSPVGLQPLSNVQPAPTEEPVQQLINPKFYFGGAPRHIEEAWQKAFGPATLPPRTSSRRENPKIRLLPLTQYEASPSPVVPVSSEDDSGAVTLPPSPRPVPFQLIPSPPVAGGALFLIPVPTPSESIVPELGEPTSEPPLDPTPAEEDEDPTA